MTKLTFDIDFNKDPEEILREIQERAKEEVAKRESKEKTKIYLSNLHKRVNEDLGTKYASINDLIRALSAHANPKSRSKTQAISPTGRRITVSMNKEIFDEIKDLLTQPNPNKAAIARQTGVSVVQVRKVATGGYDKKFEGESLPDKPSISPAPKLSSDFASNTPAPPPAPSLGLPPIPDTPPPAPEPPHPEPVAEEPLLLPPSFGEGEADIPAPIAPPPAPSLDLPPISDAPLTAPSLTPGTPPKPSSSMAKKTHGASGQPGGTKFSLKSGKKKTTGLKITRPPMRPPSA